MSKHLPGCLVAQLCLALCDPLDCSPPGNALSTNESMTMQDDFERDIKINTVITDWKGEERIIWLKIWLATTGSALIKILDDFKNFITEFNQISQISSVLS